MRVLILNMIYWQNNKFPQPPAFIFLIDVSYNAVKNGMVGIVCQSWRHCWITCQGESFNKKQCDQNNTAHSVILFRDCFAHVQQTLHVQLWRCLCIVPAERTLMWNQTFELASSPTIKCFISIMWRPLSPSHRWCSVRCGWHVCALLDGFLVNVSESRVVIER